MKDHFRVANFIEHFLSLGNLDSTLGPQLSSLTLELYHRPSPWMMSDAMLPTLLSRTAPTQTNTMRTVVRTKELELNVMMMIHLLLVRSDLEK